MSAPSGKGKGPEQTGPDASSCGDDSAQRKWIFLEGLAHRGGEEYIKALCYAIDSEEAIPTAALKPLANALRSLIGDGADARTRQNKFADIMGLKKKRGRPRADDAKFWRAFNYWFLRYMDGPLTDSEAISWLESRGSMIPDEEGRLDVMEESSIRRAVRENPAAEALARGICKTTDEGGI